MEYQLDLRDEFASTKVFPVVLTANRLKGPSNALFEDCFVQIGDEAIKAVIQLGGTDHNTVTVYFRPPIPPEIDAVGAAKSVYEALLSDHARLDAFRTEARGEGDTERPIGVWTDGDEHLLIDLGTVTHRLHRAEAESLSRLLKHVLDMPSSGKPCDPAAMRSSELSDDLLNLSHDVLSPKRRRRMASRSVDLDVPENMLLDLPDCDTRKGRRLQYRHVLRMAAIFMHELMGRADEAGERRLYADGAALFQALDYFYGKLPEESKSPPLPDEWPVWEAGDEPPLSLFEVGECVLSWDGRVMRLHVEVTGVGHTWSLKLDAVRSRLAGPLVPSFYKMPADLQEAVEKAIRQAVGEQLERLRDAASTPANETHMQSEPDLYEPAVYQLSRKYSLAEGPLPSTPVEIVGFGSSHGAMTAIARFPEMRDLGEHQVVIGFADDDPLLQTIEFAPVPGERLLPIVPLQGLFEALLKTHCEDLDVYRINVAHNEGMELPRRIRRLLAEPHQVEYVLDLRDEYANAQIIPATVTDVHSDDDNLFVVHATFDGQPDLPDQYLVSLGGDESNMVHIAYVVSPREDAMQMAGAAKGVFEALLAQHREGLNQLRDELIGVLEDAKKGLQ